MGNRVSPLVLVVCVIGFFFSFIEQMGAPILPVYALAIGADLRAVALIVACGFTASAALKLGLGFLVKIRWAARILTTGLVFFAIANFVYMSAVNVQDLILARILHGIASAIVIISGLSLATALSGPISRARSVTIYLGLATLGQVLGPAIGSAVAALSDVRGIFRAALVFSIFPIVLASILSFATRTPGGELEQSKASDVSSRVLSHQSKVAIYVLAHLSYCIYFSTLLTYIPTYLSQSFAASAQLVLLVIFGFYLLGSVTAFGADIIISIIGERKAMIITFWNFILFSFLLYEIRSFWITVGSVMFMGLSYGLMRTLLAVRISKTVTGPDLVLAISLFFLALDGGFIIGPTATSSIAVSRGIPSALVLSTAPAIVLAPLLFRSYRSRPNVN